MSTSQTSQVREPQSQATAKTARPKHTNSQELLNQPFRVK
jgi:hypothetical protein